MNLSHLLTCLSVVAVSVSADCTTNQTNTARELFKDCMDMAQANLLKINIEDEDNNIKLYCDGLEEFSSGCSAAIESFSECKSREEVNNLVAIHINSIAELLSRPSLDLKSCPAFRTSKPPPTVSLASQRATQLPLRSTSDTVSPVTFLSQLLLGLIIVNTVTVR